MLDFMLTSKVWGKGSCRRRKLLGIGQTLQKGCSFQRENEREERERDTQKERKRDRDRQGVLVVQVLLEAAQRQRDLEQAALLRRLWRFIQMQLKGLSLG